MKNQLDLGQKSNAPNQFLKIVLIAAGIFVFLCGLTALGAAYKFGRPFFSPTSEVILEPDYALISTVDHIGLATDAEILTARANDLGTPITFVVAENNQIIAQVPTSRLSQNLIGEIIEIGLLELVDFGETPVEAGTTIATDFSYEYFTQVAGTKWHTLITNAEFESAYVQQDQFGVYQIAFTLTASGAKILSDYTTDNVGHYIGIVMDKVVISAPKVDAPITSGSGIIAGSFTQEQAESLAVYLHVRGPLPIPLEVIQISEESK